MLMVLCLISKLDVLYILTALIIPVALWNCVISKDAFLLKIGRDTNSDLLSQVLTTKVKSKYAMSHYFPDGLENEKMTVNMIP